MPDNFQCPFCKGTTFYILSDKRLKCKQCHKRFSPFKNLHVKVLMETFCENLSTKEVCSTLQLSKPTIFQYFSLFRQLLTVRSKNLYHEKSQKATEYDEYIYKNHNIIAFKIENSIYTLLLNNYNLSHNKLYKISHLESFDSLLKEFWLFLEHHLKQYHGISQKYFIEYLKEAEFFFNTPQNSRFEIIEKLWEAHQIKNL